MKPKTKQRTTKRRRTRSTHETEPVPLTELLVMPRLERIWRIHRELRSGQLVPAAALAGKLQVSMRTLRQDIAIMAERLDLSVMLHAKSGCYYYGLGHLRLPPVLIRWMEGFALKVSQRLPGPVRGSSLEKDAMRLFGIMSHTVKDAILVSLADIDDELTQPPPAPRHAGLGRN
jgi:hypothetical protein